MKGSKMKLSERLRNNLVLRMVFYTGFMLSAGWLYILAEIGRELIGDTNFSELQYVMRQRFGNNAPHQRELLEQLALRREDDQMLRLKVFTLSEIDHAYLRNLHMKSRVIVEFEKKYGNEFVQKVLVTLKESEKFLEM